MPCSREAPCTLKCSMSHAKIFGSHDENHVSLEKLADPLSCLAIACMIIWKEELTFFLKHRVCTLSVRLKALVPAAFSLPLPPLIMQFASLLQRVKVLPRSDGMVSCGGIEPPSPCRIEGRHSYYRRQPAPSGC
eukprot:1461889-Amphidinium_carterae.1